MHLTFVDTSLQTLDILSYCYDAVEMGEVQPPAMCSFIASAISVGSGSPFTKVLVVRKVYKILVFPVATGDPRRLSHRGVVGNDSSTALRTGCIAPWDPNRACLVYRNRRFFGGWDPCRRSCCGCRYRPAPEAATMHPDCQKESWRHHERRPRPPTLRTEPGWPSCGVDPFAPKFLPALETTGRLLSFRARRSVGWLPACRITAGRAAGHDPRPDRTLIHSCAMSTSWTLWEKWRRHNHRARHSPANPGLTP